MNYKSYIVENDFSKIKDIKSILIYGENIGLKKNFKELIKNNNNKTAFISFSQDEILTNANKLFRELDNSSLFDDNKIVFLENCNDKILKVLEKYFESGFNFQTIIFSDILDKKSKLRKYYEKSETYGSIACYSDNKITMQKIITEKLKTFKGLNSININLIIEASNLDRSKLENEIEKIDTFFLDKNIETEKLSDLLNLATNDDFSKLKDEAIKGNKNETNKLLNNTTIDADKSIYYLAVLNQRLNKLLEINNSRISSNVEELINSIKPPVFWKEKPILIDQIKKWSSKKIIKALKETYNLEIEIKKNSSISKNIIIKKLILDICNLANSS